MKFIVEKSFDRDIDKIKDKKLLQKLRDCIFQIENADNLGKIPYVKKIEGYSSFYRIKIGDYRLGVELVSDTELILIRFLNRKEIYRYFPKRRR
jgi:mRNA interferase RelE/StbE